MNRAEVVGAFNAQVRQSTEPDGTGATFEADEYVVRRYARPGRGGSGVFWSALDAEVADAVIAAQVSLFAARGEEFEWKLYSYDEPADLAGRLVAAGLHPDEPESWMVAESAGVCAALSGALPPDGVRLVEVTDPAGVDLLADVHEAVFGKDESQRRAELRAQLKEAPESTCLVIALAGEEPVSAARIEFGPGAFAGLWGGGTIEAWRGRGIYRAMVRHRAERAIARGYPYLTVDASDQSRPILERIGFECLAITTPYLWSPVGQPA